MLKADVVKKACMMNWLKKLMQLVQRNKILKKKTADGGKKITDTSKFIEIH